MHCFASIGAGKRTRRDMATVAQGEAIAQNGECTGTRPICSKLTSEKLVDQLSLVLRLTHYFSEVSIFYLVNDWSLYVLPCIAYTSPQKWEFMGSMVVLSPAWTTKSIQIQGKLAHPTGIIRVVLGPPPGLHPSSRPRTLVYFHRSARDMGHKLQQLCN